MAYREVDMWEILEVLQLAGRGESISSIKRATGRSRKSVRRYLRLAAKSGWKCGIDEPTESHAGRVQQQVRPVTAESAPGTSEATLWPHRDRIRSWLASEMQERGLRLTKVQQLLARLGVQVPYSSLHRFVVKHCGFADHRRLTVRRSDCKPGEMVEVDFGRLGVIWDPQSNRRRVLHALIVTLGYSRHMYVHVTHSQKLEDLIEGLEDAWEFFGGVASRVVLDNLKAAVVKADRYAPVFQRIFAKYSKHRGFVIDAAVVRHPKGKPIVERCVQYVRENFFRGEQWLDREHVQRNAVQWCRSIAGMRVHGTTRQQPFAVFEAEEQPALQALDKPRFDPPSWGECAVHPDHHVQFQKAFYSVPTGWIGKRVWVRSDRKLVRLYSRGELIKTHPRMEAGKRSTDFNDYPKEKSAYALRDPNRMVHAAQKRGIHVGSFMAQLMSGDFPWSRLRQGQKLLRLCDKYGNGRVDLACRRAMAFELNNVRRVETIVQNHLEQEPVYTQPHTPAPILALRFVRDPQSFSHQPSKGETHD